MPTLANWKKALVVASAVSALAPTPAHAADVDAQKWSMFTVQKELSKRWRAYFEVQPRFGNDISRFDRGLVRPAIGYRVTPKFSIWQGYAWSPVYQPTFRDEHRFFQQFLYEDNFGKWGFVSRTRFEQRLIDGAGETAHRFRTMLRVSHPISADKRWYGVVFDELFWNLNTVNNGPISGFDQNRTFIGIGRQVNKELRIETGYLLASVNSPAGVPDRQLNAWLTWFSWRL